MVNCYPVHPGISGERGMTMNCKFCQAELEEGSSICPACGRDNDAVEVAPIEQAPETAEQSPKEAPEKTPDEKKPPQDGSRMTAGKLTLIIALAVVAVAIVVALIFATVSAAKKNPEIEDTSKTDQTTDASSATDDTTAPAETTEATVPADGNPDDVTCKGTYTVSDDALLAARDTVVATAGDASLTVGQLQVYYWRSFYNFMNTYGSNAAYFGLDYTQPLDTQTCSIFEGTWQQYFLSSALSDWHRYQSLALEARANSLTLDAEQQDYLDNLEANLDATAKTYGFENSAEMLKSDMGAAATVDDYAVYVRLSYEGYLFFSSEYDKLAPTEAEIEAYFTEHATDYESEGITKDTGNYVDVRHILISPEGGTTDESGNTTYSDEEWAACEAAAQQILDTWLNGEKTEESFAALANAHSTDRGSNTNGGLYENVAEGDMVTEFNDWCFDEARQVGDYGLVKTKFGYHIMYFCGSEPIWHATAWEDLMNELSNNVITAAADKYPMEVDYSAIVLGFVDQVTAS